MALPLGRRVPAAGPILALWLALSACQVAVTPGPGGGASPSPKATRATGGTPAPTTTAKPGPGATPGATGTGTPAPAATPTFAPVPLTLLRGVVQVDASYMVAAGAGNLVGNSGNTLVGNSGNTIVAAGAGNMVAAGAGNLIGLDGGSLIGQDGGSLIGMDGGSLIGMDGGSLIGQDGGSLIGQDGGSMVAAGAGNMVAAGAGNMVAAGAGNAVGTNKFRLPAYGLLADTAPPPGTMLPAANMVVCLFDMASGKRAIATKDPAAGDRSYVLTNAQGEYVAPVRASIAGNVVVMAEPPKNVDARFRVGAIARPAEGGARADLDAAADLTAHFVRSVFRARLSGYVLEFDGNDGTINFADTPVSAAEQEAANRVFGRLTKAATEVGLKAAGQTAMDRVGLRMADVVIADTEIDALPINPKWTKGWTPETPDQAAGTELAKKAITDVALKLHDAAAQRLKADPNHFTAAALAQRGAPTNYKDSVVAWGDKVRTPMDVVTFWIDSYLSSTKGYRYGEAIELFTDCGLTANDLLHFKVGSDAFVLQVFLLLAFDAPSAGSPDGIGTHLEQIIRSKGEGAYIPRL